MKLGRQHAILWSATVPNLSLVERVEVAAAAGYGRTSFSPADDERVRASGHTPSSLRSWARDHGVEVDICDSVIEWYPHHPPKRPMGGSTFTVDDVLSIATAYGARSVSALPAYYSDLDIDGFVEHFAALCDRAAEHGLLIHIEFVPLGAIKGVDDAWEIVRRADRPNGGVLFDTWHFWYGSRDFAALEAVPGERLMAVQVSDGPEVPESLARATFLGRLLPGEGVFDFARMLSILDAKGALDYCGPEVLSASLNDMAPLDAARLVGDRYDALLQSVFG